MHQTRNEVIRLLPLPRKGTKYIAYAARHNSTSVPVVIAVRDMLKLASTTKEAKHMIHNKMLRVNGHIVKDLHDPITLFSIFQADKKYKLMILPTGRFAFEETKDITRLLKIVGKTAVGKGLLQYNLHDGTNVISKESMPVGDTLVIDFENKIKKHIALEKGKKVSVFSGSNVGKQGIVSSVNGRTVTVNIDGENGGIVLHRAHVIAQ